MPPSVDEWLPETHLARFVVEVVEGLDLRAMSRSYRGSGSASYHPTVLLSLLVYGYATGVFSSRKLERATYDFGGVPLHRRQRAPRPRHHRDIPASLSQADRRRCSSRCCSWRARWACSSWARWRSTAPRSTPMPAATARCPIEHAGKIEAQLKAEVTELLAKAEAADQADVPDGMSIPGNWRAARHGWRSWRRHAQRSRLGAKERFERKQAEYQARLAARKAKAEATGKNPAVSRRSRQ